MNSPVPRGKKQVAAKADSRNDNHCGARGITARSLGLLGARPRPALPPQAATVIDTPGQEGGFSGHLGVPARSPGGIRKGYTGDGLLDIGSIAASVVSLEEGHRRGMAVSPLPRGRGIAGRLFSRPESELRVRR